MNIAVDIVCYIIGKARELIVDAPDVSDESDDDVPAFASSPEQDELLEFIDSLDDAEQIELVALAWISQGTFTGDDRDEAVDAAAEEHPGAASDYLLTLPLLADDLDAGLAEMGLSCDDED